MTSGAELGTCPSAEEKFFDDLTNLVLMIQFEISRNPGKELDILQKHTGHLSVKRQAQLMTIMRYTEVKVVEKKDGADISIETPDGQKITGTNLEPSGAADVLKSHGVVKKTSDGGSASGNISGKEMADVARALGGKESAPIPPATQAGPSAKVKEELAT